MTQTKKESATKTRLRCMEDRQFRRWYETLSLKSENTAHSYRQWAVRLTRLVGLDPLSYVALYREDPDAFDDVNQDIVNAMVRAGRAESTVITCISAIKSWAAWSRCKFGRTLVIGKAPRAPIASKQRIPSQAGLRLVLDHLDPRSRACLGFRALAGLRPGILGTRTGKNGLRLKFLEGLTVEGSAYRVEAKTLKVNVPEELSKNGRAFFTFLGGEGIDYFTAYLDKRIAAGEVLTPESPVIAAAKSCNRSDGDEFVKRETLTEPISRAMKAAGIMDSPYIWRSYFKTQLIIAQSKKGLLGEYVEFWMGHDGGIKGVYSFHKEVGAEIVEEMQATYESKALPFLQTRSVPGDDHTKEDLTRILLESFDVPEEVVDGIDLENAEPDELRELMREHRDAAVRKLVKEATPKSSPVMASGPRQLVVPVAEVQTYVTLGWRYLYEARLPEGQALMEAPTQDTSAPIQSTIEVAVS